METIKYIWLKRRGILVSLFILFLFGIILIVTCFPSSNGLLRTVGYSFGTSFSAGSIVSLFDLVRETAELLDSQSVKDIVDSGLSNIYSHRDNFNYYELIEKAQQIDVAGYSLRGFIQSHQNTLRALSQNSGFKMRIVLVNPESEISKNREVLENKIYSGVFKSNVDMICTMFKDIPNVEVYFIDYALSTAYCRINDTIFVGPHFFKDASKSTLTMRFESGTWGYNEYIDEFEKMCEIGSRQQ